MRYFALLILAVAVCVGGCGKKESTKSTVESRKEKAPTMGIHKDKQATPAPKPESAKQTPAKPGAWVKLPSGLQYKDIKIGSGPVAKSGDSVTVHYKGWLDNGEVFDTSKTPGREPFGFQLGAGQVIPGWDQGVPGMKVGGKRELKIPYDLAYGERGQGPIPPKATLHFDVELLKVGE